MEDPTKKMMARCEKLYPKLRHGRCCIPCLIAWRVTESTEIHHIIRRANPLTRYMLSNLLPVCHSCHQKIHEGKLTEPISEQQREYLNKMANKSLKGLCIARGITTEEYFRQQYEEMKEQILI